MQSQFSMKTALAVMLLSLLFMGGCNEDFNHFDEENGGGGGGGGGSNGISYTYTVKLVNLTANQPMSPMAVVIHNSGYSPWTLGKAASEGLEKLAEDGVADGFLSEADSSGTVIAKGKGGATFGPGASQSVSLTINKSTGIALSVATSLGNTNDGFTGMAALDISGMAIGSTETILVVGYDAGTEANTETAVTVPGPAALGEGYNSMRDDVDFISVHRGVVTADDGLATSVLDQSHRFNSPVAKLVVTKIRGT